MIHIQLLGADSQPAPVTTTDDARTAIRIVAEPGDVGYITQRPHGQPSVTRRFQVDAHGRIRFTSSYTA